VSSSAMSGKGQAMRLRGGRGMSAYPRKRISFACLPVSNRWWCLGSQAARISPCRSNNDRATATASLLGAWCDRIAQPPF
jgi:hypothetical protein